jgi:REP element-mobilizing transposase RayT
MHILMQLPGTLTVSSVMRIIKSETTKAFVHSTYFPNFEGWGEGFASFTVSESATEIVKNYIINQTEHHQNQSLIPSMEMPTQSI